MWLPLLTVVALSGQSPPPTPPAAVSILVTSAGLRLRAAPRPDADVVGKIGIGTVLTCLERSAPVTVGSATGAFCRVRVDGQEGYVYEPLTAPLERDRRAQEDRLIVQKTQEGGWHDKARWPDLYELHGWASRRTNDGPSKESLMRAMFLELALVAAAPDAFHADPRIYVDEAQGRRMRLEVIQGFERQAAGTSAAESAAWLAVEIGKPFECEGYLPCVFGALVDIECGYLTRHPRGAHAGAARDRVHESLTWATEFVPQSEQPVDDALDHLARVEGCLRTLPATENAAALAQAKRVRDAIRKAAPKSPASP